MGRFDKYALQLFRSKVSPRGTAKEGVQMSSSKFAPGGFQTQVGSIRTAAEAAPKVERTIAHRFGYEQAWRIYQQLHAASQVDSRTDDEQRDIDLFFGLAMKLKDASR